MSADAVLYIAVGISGGGFRTVHPELQRSRIGPAMHQELRLEQSAAPAIHDVYPGKSSFADHLFVEGYIGPPLRSVASDEIVCRCLHLRPGCNRAARSRAGEADQQAGRTPRTRNSRWRK